MTAKKSSKFIPCSLRELPEEIRVEAMNTAIDENPNNRPRLDSLPALVSGLMEPMNIAVLTTKYWGAEGVRLGVSFMEDTAPQLRDKIIGHMNAWSEFCNVKFAWSQSQGDVRISRGGGGYWSYLGTDVRHIPAGKQTMNLQGFVLNTPESEYKRVVRHETGHTLGFPHEHMRKQIVQLLDPAKTIDYFKRFQGWSAAMTQQQVLTPIEEKDLVGTVSADVQSIMCYQLPGSITKDGKPIPGGNDIDNSDKQFAAKIYPLTSLPPTGGNGDKSGGTSGLISLDLTKKVITSPAGWTLKPGA